MKDFLELQRAKELVKKKLVLSPAVLSDFDKSWLCRGIAQHAFSYLNDDDLCRCMLVCKEWAVLATDPYLWKERSDHDDCKKTKSHIGNSSSSSSSDGGGHSTSVLQKRDLCGRSSSISSSRGTGADKGSSSCGIQGSGSARKRRRCL